jgi:hypothetical protein
VPGADPRPSHVAFNQLNAKLISGARVTSSDAVAILGVNKKVVSGSVYEAYLQAQMVRNLHAQGGGLPGFEVPPNRIWRNFQQSGTPNLDVVSGLGTQPVKSPFIYNPLFGAKSLLDFRFGGDHNLEQGCLVRQRQQPMPISQVIEHMLGGDHQIEVSGGCLAVYWHVLVESAPHIRVKVGQLIRQLFEAMI